MRRRCRRAVAARSDFTVRTAEQTISSEDACAWNADYRPGNAGL